MSTRYSNLHKNPSGPGDSRPTALDIIKDESLTGAWSDKVALITGCSSGIGIETARAIAATGAKVFCGVRDVAKGSSALASILKPGQVELLKMDLNSLASIRAAAAEFLEKSKALNILINNAGVMATPEGKTADGFETQFGTCHLAHFLLFQLLKPTLLSSSTPQFASRVINLSSSGHRSGGIRFEDYNFEKEPYSPWPAYGQAKTANIYMANEIERRYGGKGLHAWAVMPGGIKSGLQAHAPGIQEMMEQEDVKKIMKSPEQGAATTVFAAVGKEWEGRGGKYLEDCEVAPKAEGGLSVAPGYAEYAYNEEGEKRLWKDSCKMVGVEDDQ